MKALKEDLKQGYKYRPFIRRFKPELKNGKVIVDGLPIIPEKDVPALLEKLATESKVPLGIRSMWSTIKKQVGHGVTRSMIQKYLEKDQIYQNIQKRGARPSESRKHKPEGKTRYVFKKYPNTIGIDLIQVGNTFSNKYKDNNEYITVVVHKYSGYTLASASEDKQAATILRTFKRIYERFKSLFGKIRHLEQDNGSEFKSVFAEFCKQSGIKTNILTKVSYVENRNSLLQRNMSFVSGKMPFKKALKLSWRKINLTPNRTLGGKTPNELTGFKTPQAMIKSAPKTFRKYKGGTKKVKVFKKDDKVKIVMKSYARETAASVGYKSYKGKHWSKKIHTVIFKRGDKYKVNDVPYMLYSDELKLYVPPKFYEKKKKVEFKIEEPEPKKLRRSKRIKSSTQ